MPRTLIWTGKRRTPYGLNACLLKYIHLSAIGNEMEKMQPTLRAKISKAVYYIPNWQCSN